MDLNKPYKKNERVCMKKILFEINIVEKYAAIPWLMNVAQAAPMPPNIFINGMRSNN